VNLIFIAVATAVVAWKWKSVGGLLNFTI